MDILKRIAFILLIIGFISGEVLRFDNGGGISFTFFDIAVCFFVGITILLTFFQKHTIIVGKADKFLFWFVGIGLVSLLLQLPELSPYQTIVATLYAIRFIVYTIGISWSVQILDERFKKNIPLMLFITSTVLSVIGFFQYLYYPELRNLYYAGWDPHLYRIFSTFLDPNFMGLLYVCGAIIGVYLFLEKYQQKLSLEKIILGLGTVVNILALFLTYSRGAYLAFFVAITVMLWRGGKKKFILGTIAVGIFLVIAIELISPRSEGTKLFRSASIRDRITSLQQVSVIISHHPYLGVGFDAYRYAQEREGFLTENINTTHSGAGTDNSFLFAFATTGLAGFVTYLLMTWNILKVSFTPKTIAARALFASYIALIVGSSFVNALFYPFFLVWVWILVGLA